MTTCVIACCTCLSLFKPSTAMLNMLMPWDSPSTDISWNCGIGRLPVHCDLLFVNGLRIETDDNPVPSLW